MFEFNLAWAFAISALGLGSFAGLLAFFRFEKTTTDDGHEDEARRKIGVLIDQAQKVSGEARDMLDKRITDAAQVITPALDLEEEADSLIAQMRDLDEQQARLDSTTYLEQRKELQQRAAARLRERDQMLAGFDPVEPVEAKPTKTTKSAKKPAKESTTVDAPSKEGATSSSQVSGFLWGAGTVAVFALLFLLLRDNSAPRAEGGSMTGNSMPGAVTPAAGGAAPSPDRNSLPAELADQEMLDLVERLKANPRDLEALVRMGHRLLRAQRFEEAGIMTKRALEIEPGNVEAQVHAALIQGGGGDGAGAMAKLDGIVKEHPTFAEAWFFRGMLSMQANDRPRMRESWTRYVEVAPDGPQKERIRAMLQGMP